MGTFPSCEMTGLGVGAVSKESLIIIYSQTSFSFPAFKWG